ncbi:MAG: hypothetical protein AB1Z98_16210 [Nannocystaceae bacterium]
MSDPRLEAAQTVDRLLTRARRGPLPPPDCEQLLEAVGSVPGRLRPVAQALSKQRDPAAVDALLRLSPAVPGVVEGVFGAIAAGVSRRRWDGASCPHLLAIDFTRSRAKSFGALVDRSRRVFGREFERLDVGGQPCFRVGLREGPGTFAGRVAARSQDVQWLHGKLGRLKGTRLWLNGWCFAVDGPWKAPIQSHLLRAWLSWAASQTHTQTQSETRSASED